MVRNLAGICAAVPIVLAAVVAPVVTAPPVRTVAGLEVILTDQVYVVGGAGWETVPEDLMRQLLGSRYDQDGNEFTNIEWPGDLGALGTSVTEASDDLYALITDPENTDKKIAIGVSASTFVVNDVMRRLAADPNPDKPKPGDITFVIIGDGERGLMPAVAALTGPELPLVNYATQPPPTTPYNAIVVKGEYDGLADWPDRPWNLLASFNAIVGSPAVEGFGSIHWDSMWVDIDDPAVVPPKNITVEVNAAGGTTTTYLVPTKELPMLYPLRGQGVPEPVISALNTLLKPIVDTGYRRNDVTIPRDTPVIRPTLATPARPPRTAADKAASVKNDSSTQGSRPAVSRTAATR